jgi:hypothetical protein
MRSAAANQLYISRAITTTATTTRTTRTTTAKRENEANGGTGKEYE